MRVFSTRRQLLFSLATVLLTLSLIVGCSTSLAPSSTDQADDASANDPPASVTTLLSTTPESGEVLQVAGEAHTFTLRFDGPIKIAEGTLTAAADGHTETFDWTQVAALTGTNTNDITVTLPDRLVGDAPYTFTLNGGVNDENGSGIDLSDTALRFTTPPGRAGPVQNLQAIVGDAAAEIRFQAPIHDGGHEVTGYSVERRVSGSSEASEWTQIETSALSSDDAGVYAVAVDNLFNGERYDVRVTAVNESGVGIAATTNVTPSPVPTAPTLQLTPGENLITLKLGPPAYLGSEAPTVIVTEYRLSESDPWQDADTKWASIPDFELELRDLTPGVPVQLRAAYGNANGIGAYASAVATPYGKPQAVQNLTLDAGDGELTVTFDPPTNSGGVPITQYEVAYGPEGNTSAFTQTTTGTTVTLDGLTNGETHHVSVTAVNERDYKSDAVAASTVVQPLAYRLAGDDSYRVLGRHVSISGDRMAAISRGDNNYPQLDLYAFDGGWVQDTSFDINNLVEAADEQNGDIIDFTLDSDPRNIDLSLDGDWLALGLPDVGVAVTFENSGWSSDRVGLVLILKRDATSGWTFDPINQIWNDTNGIEWTFGWDVALSGNTLAVAAPVAGAPEGYGKVVVYDFNRTSGTTDNATTINIPTGTPSAGDAFFGESVVLDGDRMAVSSTLVDAPPNHAFVFNRNGGSWTYEYTSEAAAPFSDPFADLELGIALSGDHLAVSDPTANGLDGQVTLYRAVNGTWTKDITLASSSNSEYFGYTVGFADGYLIATAHSRNALNATPQLHCFDLTSSTTGTLTLDELSVDGVLSSNATDIMALDTDGDQLAVGRPWAGGAGRNAGEILVVPDASRLCTDSQ